MGNSEKPTRRMTHAAFACALTLGLTMPSPAHAQTPAATFSKAQETLAQIERLIDSIDARKTEAMRGAASNGEPLFDGHSLAGWTHTTFRGAADVRVDKSFRGGESALIIEAGNPLNGVTWLRSVPKTNYEITLQAMKIDGADFMCGLTFPVGNSNASLILGGWGGQVTGISSIDGSDASENETMKSVFYPKDHWFHVRMRVTPTKLQAWLDDKQIVNANIVGKKISMRRGEIIKSVPLGIATYQTTSAFRDIKLRKIAAAE